MFGQKKLTMTKFAGKYNAAVIVAMRTVLESWAAPSAEIAMVLLSNTSARPIWTRLIPLSCRSS